MLTRDSALSDLFRISIGEKAKSQISPSLLHERVERYAVLSQIEQGEVAEISPLMFANNEFGEAPIIARAENGDVKMAAGSMVDLYGVYKRVDGIGGTLDVIGSFMHALSEHSSLLKIDRTSAGIGLHMDRPDGTSTTIYALNGQEHTRAHQPGIRNLPLDVWKKVLAIYWDRFIEKLNRDPKIDDVQKKRLIAEFDQKLKRDLEISRMLKERSLILAWSDDPKSNFTIPNLTDSAIRVAEGRIPSKDSLPEHLAIDGAITIVFSRSVPEPLPCELLLGIQLPRDGRTYFEIGRLGVDRGRALPVGDRLFKLAEAMSCGAKDVGKVVIHADSNVHRVKWKKPGFIEMKLNQDLPDGVTVLEDDPQVIQQRLCE